MARLSAFTSSEASEPTGLPKRLLGTAVNLSTIIRQGARSPLRALGWTESLKIGACVGSVVKGHTTIESRADLESIWRFARPTCDVGLSLEGAAGPRPEQRRTIHGEFQRGPDQQTFQIGP